MAKDFEARPLFRQAGSANAKEQLPVVPADRGYVIVHGRIAFEGKSAEELNNNDLIRKFYLGL